MSKKLTQFELETIVIALEKYYFEVENEHPNLTATLEHIEELGREFVNRADKISKGWGLNIRSRWEK